MIDFHESRVDQGVGSAMLWGERLLFTLALVLGLWWLLATAQMRFYASLPVPKAPASAAVLPGEGVESSGPYGTPNRDPARIVQPGEWVARLEAPAVGLTATVIEGSTDDMLARAAGHIEGTSLPGETGNVGIAGHRDTTFRAVRKLKVGDVLRLETASGTWDYRIGRTFIVNPEDVYVLDPTTRPTLTLVTCYPFTFIGHAPKRYIVQATQISAAARR